MQVRDIHSQNHSCFRASTVRKSHFLHINRRTHAEPSAAMARVLPPPFCLRRGAQKVADQGWRLFEPAGRVRARPRRLRAPQVAPAKPGSQAAGSPFLCLLSFGEAKESKCAVGRTPRHPRPPGRDPACLNNYPALRIQPIPTPPPQPRHLQLFHVKHLHRRSHVLFRVLAVHGLCRARSVSESPARTQRHGANNLNSCWRDRPNGIGWVG